MKKIPLTKGQYAIVDDEDFEYLNQWKWGALKTKSGWYAKRGETKNRKHKTILMHREIMKLHYGDFKKIDHKDSNTLDNRKENLRICTHQENMCNQHKSFGTSKFKGVYWHKLAKKWTAMIRINHKSKYLGLWEREDVAALAYDIAAVKYFGEFAYCNFS